MLNTIFGADICWQVALDGRFRGDDTSLASSTLLADENNKDIFGLVISYSVKVGHVVFNY